ncbi:L,D-transpeptidase [Blastochloris tepida]|uniref:L,D-transpeptidase n=1 Tax=Blastochloris tepida TaxID=2233851 RepID=A0A348FWS5_9HYPH|nr:L,D-transpeptidase [Blastochloris tepida]BBF91758.1 L,D-transpeptidase [Blastochloris tepida]
MRIRVAGALLAAMLAAGCNSVSYDPVPESAFTARDRQEFAKQSFTNVLPEPDHLRQIVTDPTRENPGTIVVDTQNRWLYFVLPEGKAIRYGVAVGKEAFAWSGVAKVGRKEQWPGWTPTEGIHSRMRQAGFSLPSHMPGSADNPLGARALYLYEGGKDTLFRIHGTNEPELIGSAVSSGCIRMLNADVIDLFNRTPVGAKVIVI